MSQSNILLTVPKGVNPLSKVFVNQIGSAVALHVNQAKIDKQSKLVVEITFE